MERTKVLDKTYMFNLLKGVAESAQKKVIQRPKAKWKKAFCKIRGCQVQIIWRGLSVSLLLPLSSTSKVQALEFMPAVFTKKEPMEITSIKAGPQTRFKQEF